MRHPPEAGVVLPTCRRRASSFVLLTCSSLLGGCQAPTAEPQVALDPEPDAALPDATSQDAFAREPVPCARARLFVDADGDGLGSGIPQERPWGCEGQPTPVGFALEAGDCDDADARVYQQICVDRDGDGAAAYACVGDALPAERQPCVTILEWTPAPGPYDCHDSDPTLIDYYYRDADGDGRGAGDKVCFRPDAAWSAYDDDCDDADSSKAPLRADVFGDGVDTDCDGDDGGPCGRSSLDDFEWPTERASACGEVDVALGSATCSGCGWEAVTLAVENRGSASARLDLTLVSLPSESWDRPYELSFSLALAPGERRRIVSGPFAGDYELKSASPDCNLENNRAYVPGGHCI
jgi:hypothetical protein